MTICVIAVISWTAITSARSIWEMSGETEVFLPVVKVPEVALLMDRFREMTREIRKYQRKIQETERLATAGVVAAGLAHEIRNPLTSLKLAGQMLEQSLEGRPAERSRAEIKEGGARAELCLPARRPGVSGNGARDA
ncbi:MAG: hypothetical protein K6360_00215 [Deltaproteobacteria bacterium]